MYNQPLTATARFHALSPLYVCMNLHTYNNKVLARREFQAISFARKRGKAENLTYGNNLAKAARRPEGPPFERESQVYALLLNPDIIIIAFVIMRTTRVGPS